MCQKKNYESSLLSTAKLTSVIELGNLTVDDVNDMCTKFGADDSQRSDLQDLRVEATYICDDVVNEVADIGLQVVMKEKAFEFSRFHAGFRPPPSRKRDIAILRNGLQLDERVLKAPK